MAVSEAKLQANRRNALKSCGPRTESGKSRSKLNAVKHGMRAATLVLLDEDARSAGGSKSRLDGQPDAPRRSRTADR